MPPISLYLPRCRMKFTGMSPVEVQFVRLYIVTLRREYDLVRSVLDVMSPDGLSVKNFVAAVNISRGLHEMQRDFDSAISRIQKQKKIRKIDVPLGPTLEELVNLFSLSFFKLITVEDATPETKEKTQHINGWFSGKPEEWKKTLLSLKSVPKNKGTNLPDLLSNFFQTALKFFPFHEKKWDLDDDFGVKKIWPAQNETNYYEDYEDDDEDAGDNYPFDWLFDDYND